MEPAALRALLERDDGRERAFVDAMIRMGWSRTTDPALRAELGELHRELQIVARRSHEALRSAIAAGTCRGAALRKRFDDAPAIDRDHFVEEVLGIAYPPLEERALGPEEIAYMPGGYDEIVHALDVTGLGPDHRFLDIGSGMGKVVILAELLTGARCGGVECDPVLHRLAGTACRELGVGEDLVLLGDAREVPIENEDVVFMYLPFTGAVLANVLARVLGSRARFVCCGVLDPDRYPEVVPVGPAKSWLQIYRRA